MSVSKEYTDYYDDNYKKTFELMDTAIQNKEGAAGMYGVSFADTARRAFNRSVQEGIKAYAEDNGGNLPRGKARQDILDRADKKAHDAINDLQKAIQSDPSREGVQVASQTVEQKYFATGGDKPHSDDRAAAKPAGNQVTEDQALKAGYKDTGQTITLPNGGTGKVMTDANGGSHVVLPSAANAPAATPAQPNNPTADPSTSHNYTQAPDPTKDGKPLTPKEIYGGGTRSNEAKPDLWRWRK